MSLFMRRRRDASRRAPTTLVIAICAVQLLGAGQAVAADLAVVAVGMSRTDRLVSLIVDVQSAASERVPPESFSVTARGEPQPIQAVPLFSDQLAVGLVVDASEDGRPVLHAGLAGAANFVLEQPTSGAAVIADTSPPVVMSMPEARTSDAVRALSAIQAGGERRTSAALSLALHELATIPAHSRLVVLYTTGSDTGEPAADLAARLIDAHTFLAVVSTSSDVGYWLEVTRRTGGVLVAPETSGVFAAFDQVADTMRSRYLVTFPTPNRLPAKITVRVDTTEGSVTADTVVSNASVADPVESDSSARGDPGSGTRWPLIVAIVALIAVGCLVFLVLIRRRHRLRLPRLRRPGPTDSGKNPSQPPPVSTPTSDGTPTPPPRFGQLLNSTSLHNHGPGPPDDQHRCLCGCGMRPRPGRTFVNREHQTRWMSQRGSGTGQSSR